MAETYASLVAGCQIQLEDYDGQLYTPTLLLRAANFALEEVRLDLTRFGLSDLRKEQTLTLTAGSTTISSAGSPTLPADFSAPLELYERLSGSTSVYDWKPVRLVEDLLEAVEPGETLDVYAFQEGKLKFRGATTARELKLDYLADIPDFASTTDGVPVRLALAALVYLTCAAIVRATDRDGADRFRRDGFQALSKLRAVGAKRKQMATALRAGRRSRAYRGRLRPLVQ